MIKKFLSWIAGFFSADSGTSSSKRLVGIAGATTLFVTLYSNSKSEGHVIPADSLVWGTVTLSGLALGLATAKELGDMIRSFKGKPEETNTEETKTEE
jgi:hypothetical protein